MVVVVVCPVCYEVEKLRDGALEGWTYRATENHCGILDGFDEDIFDYGIITEYSDTVESYWEHDDCGGEYHGDLSDLMVRYYYKDGVIVVDKVGVYWKGYLDVLRGILSKRFKKKIVFEGGC